jgi:hypothetical protein
MLGRGGLGELVFGTFHITNAELRDCPELAGNPGCEHLTTLLLAQTGSGEVAVGDKRDDVCDDLVLVKDSIDNDRYDGRQISLSCHLDHDHNQTTGLEDSAIPTC